MPISGVVITCDQQNTETIATEIGNTECIEVRGTLPEGRIIAVIDTCTVEEEVSLVSRIHEINGVISVRMAYHNFEDIT